MVGMTREYRAADKWVGGAGEVAVQVTLASLLVLMLSFNALATTIASKDQRFTIPVLSVRGDSQEGNLSRLPFVFSRSGSQDALRISIEEDTPIGTGEDLRSSVWLAAVTAAMQRNDPLNGCRIKITTFGDTGGPSAGAVFCLAIMTAIDERELPEDFALTGTIMPDGTIGLVGGVAAKLQAAAHKGVTRAFISAFQRFEKQPDGEMIDLFNVCKDQGLKVYPVENIEEAYAILHKLPFPSFAIANERKLLELPDSLECALIADCKDNLKQLQLIPEEQLAEAADDLPGDILSFNSAYYNFQNGSLITAQQKLEFDRIVLNYWPEFAVAFDSLFKDAEFMLKGPGKDARRYAEGLKWLMKRNENTLKSFVESKSTNEVYRTGYARAAKEDTSVLRAQFESPLGRSALLSLYSHLSPNVDVDSLAERADKAYTGIFASADDKSDYVETRSLLFMLFARERLKTLILTLPGVMDKFSNRTLINQDCFRSSLKTNPTASDVEKLFYTAFRASAKEIELKVVTWLADMTEMSQDEVSDSLTSKDKSFANFYFNKPVLMLLHDLLISDASKLKDPEYHIQVTMLALAEQIAYENVLLVKYGPELGFDYDYDAPSYANPTFLSSLIRAARIQALWNIQNCRKAGIFCFAAIEAFEEAEIERDNPSSDKLGNVLLNYWKASLKAKALALSFEPAQ